MKVNIKNIVKNIGKDLDFLQPVYETIINSLEANADEIKIKFFYENDSSLFGRDYCSITGFDIEDNGDGFTSKNLEAFHELWTDNKSNIGCKGSGRFTWLSVFNNITIDSFIKDTQQHVHIPFSLEYNEKFSSTNEKVLSNKTIISFRNVTTNFYSNINNKKTDKRECSDLKILYGKILDYLKFDLFLYNRENIKFKIILIVDDDQLFITNKDIPSFESKDFVVSNPEFEAKEQFKIYYFFSSDSKNAKKAYLCAGKRPIKEVDSDSLGFSAPLPNKDSFCLLVTSNYLDSRGNDERNGFPSLMNLKTATSECPLLISSIISQTKEVMRSIITEKYKDLFNYNKREEEEALNLSPHLANFIKNDDDIVKSSKSILIKAKKTFYEKRDKIKEHFDELLRMDNITEQEFNENVESLTEMATIELGEYILYRESLIKALKFAIKDESKKEDFVHDLFMKRRTDNSDSNLIYKNNIWLLDDKFMSYSHSWSDTEVSSITSQKLKGYLLEKDGRRRPDVVIYYSKDDDSNFRDAIIIEFKGPNASHDQKMKSVYEISDNVQALRNYEGDKLRNVTAYIITYIDENMENSICHLSGYRRLSVEGGERIFYCYNENVNCHINVLDIEAIANEATDRNFSFLSILKKENLV